MDENSRTRLIRNVIVPLGHEAELGKYLTQKFRHLQIESLKVERRSLDARHRNHLVWQYNLLVELKGKIPNNPDILEYHTPQPYLTGSRHLQEKHPFIIGSGPAGLFCALAMVEKGIEPWIFEQGDQIEERDNKVTKFLHGGSLDTESNIQFGEGGAGTYSDGKLTSRNRDYYSCKVFEYLVRFGAEETILTESYPHLGTDVLKKVIKNLRSYLESRGVLFFWRHQLKDIRVNHGNVCRVLINEMGYVPEVMILATGNSGRLVYRLLDMQVPMEAKAFAAGFRIEHPQAYLNALFYGEKTDISKTGAASYRIKGQFGGRGVYSFCMCPGGLVVNGTSENGGIVTNGMSYSSRSGKYGNSALVAQVDQRDFGNEVLSGMKFQEQIEKKCFEISKLFVAPGQQAQDYLSGKSGNSELKSTFQPGIIKYDLEKIYSPAINNSLKQALTFWEKHYPGFAREGVLIAPETRTSAPLRIMRDHVRLNSLGAENLYPVGEGAGYAGGIISSAADGYKTGSIFEH
ncbi:MAG: NAD(P)/FAD-dependent oxidoreductase [Candidatus Cloacimonetes bacterium]|nr:NAD(P)/FAD-dependent oxidoreductase [Candidatus Cloacimonadota bacterium]